MFNAVLSDDGTYVTLFHEDGEVEEMETFEFTLAYGTEILENESETKPSETLPAETAPEPSAEDIQHYWKAFRRLVKNCG